ncbi:MAG TPA: hypothetical protein VK731_01500 [Candidatus Cybelea sp.]|nr:hypothetical protein [Candidatus Cybelea sp.]
MNVIVDTCVWSRFLRRNRIPTDPVVVEVARLIRADAVQLLGPIRQELLSGAQPDEPLSSSGIIFVFTRICRSAKGRTNWLPATTISVGSAGSKERGRTFSFARPPSGKG